MTTLRLQPLTKEGFAPFGDVVALDGVAPIEINQGFAQRFNNLAKVDISSEGGNTNISLFAANPRSQPITINLMERHPLGTQLFYPLQDRPWAVLVCGDPKDANTYRGFSATGQQGVNYHRNVWHFPLLVYDTESRFIIVDRIGPGNNLEEVVLDKPLQLIATPDEDHMTGIY